MEPARVALSRRLAERRAEIERAALTRIYAIADPAETPDPEYVEGLRAAVAAAVGYGLAAIERGEERAPAIPAILLTQARLASRSGISLDTVLRRYVAGQALLGDFLIEEAEEGGLLRGAALQRLLAGQAALFDRLLVAISEEHGREEEGRFDTSEARKAERIERLLAGELVDASELGYQLEGWHVGIVAKGEGAEEALRKLAGDLDRRLLMTEADGEALWAWLGGRREIDREELLRCLAAELPPGAGLAIGESAVGLPGWRVTHRQARAALPIALRSPERLVRYADVALLASMLQDDLLVASLQEMYMAPLGAERDGGETMRATMRAYFDAGRNLSAAAAVLGVSRPTISYRIRVVEERIGRPISAVAADMEVALRFHDLTAVPVEPSI
jgi:hypothetical protein